MSPDRYETLETLAEDVTLARDTVLGRRVVLCKTEHTERAKKASEITHPGIAMILDLTDGEIVYEHVPGPTLRERIAQVMSPMEIAKLASDLGAALSAIHEAGLAHGAVDADHVRFSKSGAKLLGMGLAQGSAREDQRAMAVLVYEAFARKRPSLPPRPLADLDDARSPILRARLDAALARAFSGGEGYPTCRELGTMIAGAIDPPHSGAFPMLRAAELEALGRVSIVPKPMRRLQNVFAGLAVIVIIVLVLLGRRNRKEEQRQPPPQPQVHQDAGPG